MTHTRKNEGVNVTVNGRQVSASSHMTLAEIAGIDRPCGGGGRCGKCKVVARGELSPLTDSERALLTPEELERGVRLACSTRPLGDCEIFTETHQGDLILGAAGDMSDIAPTLDGGYAIAIDIGTTTIATALYGADGGLLAEASRLNPQGRWGADVISRVESALAGHHRELTESVRWAIDELIDELGQRAAVNTAEAGRCVITGNTVMLSLLTGESVEPFSHAPFAPSRLFGESVEASELGLSALAPHTQVYLPPAISAFVGSDLTCALLACGDLDKGTALLVDAGTNGEMALWHEGRLAVCSVAAGPALEGVGISCGMRASTGAVDRVEVRDGKLAVHIIGEGDARGICGSGLIDAAACMLKLDIVDDGGYMEDEDCQLCPGVTLTQRDIRMLQLAKSAICAGILTLTEEEGLPTDAPQTLYLAGGLGSSLDPQSAGDVGLIPTALTHRIRPIGNAALTGAAMLALDPDLTATAENLVKRATLRDLSTNPTFTDRFTMGMILESV